eukprot:gene8411-11391_t
MSEIETKHEDVLTSFQMPRVKHQFCSVREISSLQETLQQNPTLVQQIISSPKMMKLLQDPVMLRYIIESNPQIKSLMEARPEIGKLLRNPE